MPAARVHLEGLVKRFRSVVAVDGIDLDIAAGEFFSLLGPSGCGKTTTLRLIAGFERPDGGAIRVGEVDMSTTPPHRRPVNTVFQHYALFPHLSVNDNVGFGLRFTDAGNDERRRRIGEALDLVQLGDLGWRMPAQLSGGQQQRVALARALVLNPSVLLLDEPLGALDAKLRKLLQVELKALQERVGITFLYVTHDQEEALTMSDRLAVMDQGSIRQIGTPRDVYESPEHAFVADSSVRRTCWTPRRWVPTRTDGPVSASVTWSCGRRRPGMISRVPSSWPSARSASRSKRMMAPRRARTAFAESCTGRCSRVR